MPDPGEAPVPGGELLKDQLLQPGDVVRLDCLSSDGNACHTTYNVLDTIFMDEGTPSHIRVLITENTSRSPLQVDVEYYTSFPPINDKPEFGLVRGDYQNFETPHADPAEQPRYTRSSKVDSVTITRVGDGPDRPMVIKPFDQPR